MAGDDKVPNPEYQDLESLRGRIQKAAPAMRSALDAAAQAMGGGKVWIGTTASAWGGEVSGRKQRLAQRVQGILDDIDAELRSTPRECTKDEADAYLRGRRYRHNL
jgi:hypothetical protein